MKLTSILAAGGLLLSQCDPEPQTSSMLLVTEAAYEDFEVPDISPPTELWVKMDWTNWNPDMRFRCQNMGGYLVDDICHRVDY